MLRLYQNMFIKSFASDSNVIECFNLTDEFYREFIRRNEGYMLYMLRPLRDVINSLIELSSKYKEHLLYGCCVGYSKLNAIKVTFVFDCDVMFEKPSSFHTVIIKEFEFIKIEDKTVLSVKISAEKYE